MRQLQTTGTAIIGAGPYGLSLAAHLGGAKIPYRIFGQPMRTWSEHMPAGMCLKSEGFASNLSDPAGALTLERYCSDRALPYAHVGSPVPLQTFIEYGRTFQARFVPMLVQQDVVSLARSGERYLLRLQNGEQFNCRRVVVAVGISHFAFVPDTLSHLPPDRATHSSAHHSLERFRNRTIAVIGAGASAVDIAVLAQQAGATVHLVTRRAGIDFHDPPAPGPRPLSSRLRRPLTGLGPSWISWFSTQLPLAFHALPERVRQHVVRTHLGPAACWFTRDTFEQNVTVHARSRVSGAVAAGEGVTLTLTDAAGGATELPVDHVIAATGYRPDIARLPFLEPSLAAAVATSAGSPVLSRHFESSATGLYFVGLAAADSFGPMLRFAFGADYTARRLSRHLAKAAPAERAMVGAMATA